MTTLCLILHCLEWFGQFVCVMVEAEGSTSTIGMALATARLPRSTLFDVDDIDDEQEGERRRQLEERWRFDSDDAPPVGPDGLEEQDRTLIDDYETMYGHILLFLFLLAHQSLAGI